MMSVPVTVKVPLVAILRTTAKRRGNIVLRSRDLRFDFKELGDPSARVALVMPPDGERYRHTMDGQWLKEIGPRPADHWRYHWFLPTFQERPGEFALADVARFVPEDRRRHLARAWDKAILNRPGQADDRLPRSSDEAMVRQQLDAYAHYGDQFKVVEDRLYRVGTEPFMGLRDDGFVVGSHSSKGWRREAYAPYQLYSCAEKDRLMHMSAALDPSGEHRTSVDSFEIVDPDNFTASFIQERQVLLVKWMYGVLSAGAALLTRRAKTTFMSALANRIDGGFEALQRVALKGYGDKVDPIFPSIAEALFSLSSDAVIRPAIEAQKNAINILSALREEWEDRPVVIQPRYPLKAS